MTLLASALGCLVFHTCVHPKNKYTSVSYLVGYGVVLPIWLCFPYQTVKYLGIQNKIFRFSLTTCAPAICVFRTTAAMHGFTPEQATASMPAFIFYYASPVLARYNPETKQYTRASWATIGSLLIRFVLIGLQTGTIVSAYNILPAFFPNLAKPSSSELYYNWYDWRRTLLFVTQDPQYPLRLLWDNLCYAALFQSTLTTFATGTMFIQALVTGYETEDTMNNPVFGATSPSDFWARRWNLLIHDVLKRGCFLPVRRYTSTLFALMATFCASGIFHEWLQLTVFPQWDNEYTLIKDNNGTIVEETCRILGREGEDFSPLHCYAPQWGAAMAFFMWQAMLIVIEFTLGRRCKSIFAHFPVPIKTFLTIVAGGCVAHWFSEPYVHSNFFLDAEAGLFLWKLVPPK